MTRLGIPRHPAIFVALAVSACLSRRGPDVIFLPTAMDVVERMLALARVGPQDVVYDLGCGDGRVVIAAAKRSGARGVCIDIDPARIAESRRNADTAGVAGRIRFAQADLFEVDLSEASVVALYLSPALNQRLRPKLFRELRPGARIVSHNFDMGDWKPDSIVRVHWPSGTTSSVLYWVLPADVAGSWELMVAGDGLNRGYRVRFEQQYQRVTGTASQAGRTVALADARLDGDQLEFTVADTLGGQETELRFRGRMRGPELTGTVTAGREEQRLTWRAARRS